MQEWLILGNAIVKQFLCYKAHAFFLKDCTRLLFRLGKCNIVKAVQYF